MASNESMTMKTTRRLVIVLLLLAGGRASGQTLTTLYSFSGSDGQWPNGLFQGSDGNFYGTTFYGGTNIVIITANPYVYTNSAGTVFRITPQGTLTTLWQFGNSPSDGAEPSDGLVQGNDGNFYGTTEYGGTNSEGTVFKITPQGALTTLYQFGSNPNDGSSPVAGLVRGTDGNFYGTTFYGGTNGYGTVFKITPQGTLTTLWPFGNGSIAVNSPSDGAFPNAGLIQGSDSSFYGTTMEGGLTNLGGGYGGGTVFKITSQGALTTLYQFGVQPTDGYFLLAGLAQGSDGNFYGTTETGGTNNGGTVFKITPQGMLTTLYQFGGLSTDGAILYAGLVQGSDGNFYGTTSQGGTNRWGTVFKITSQGTLSTLWQFNYTNGDYPSVGLVQGSDGNFYGSTEGGGTNRRGTVFRISVPLNPPANQISSVQVDPSGSNLVFGIPSVAYETYQLQFTTDLTFGIWSNVPNVSVTNSIGALLTLTNFGGASGPQGFYRFVITP